MIKSKKEIINMIVEYAGKNKVFRNTLISENKDNNWIDTQKLNNFIEGNYNQYDIITLKQQELIMMYNLMLGYTRKYPALSEVFEEQEIQNAKTPSNIVLSRSDVENLVNNYELYNPQQKNDYIFELCQNDDNLLKAKDIAELFNDRVSDLEYQYNKDFCYFNKDEIIDSLGGLLSSSFYTIKSDLKRYFKWCVAQSIITEDSLELFSEITYDDINSEKYYKNNYYKDFDDFSNHLNSLSYNKINELKLYSSSLVMLLSWIGFDLNEIINVKNKDIYFKENKISINNKTIDNISDNVMDLIKISYDNLSETEEGYLFKKITTDEHISMALLRCYIFEFNGAEDNKKMLVKKVRMSGIFNRFYKWEQENGEIDFSNVQLIKCLSCMSKLSKAKSNILAEIYSYWKQYMF